MTRPRHPFISNSLGVSGLGFRAFGHFGLLFLNLWLGLRALGLGVWDLRLKGF